MADEAAALRLLRRKGTDEIGFLQFFNVHRSHAAAFAGMVLGPALAGTAAQLLGVPRVRVYQVRSGHAESAGPPAAWGRLVEQ